MKHRYVLYCLFILSFFQLKANPVTESEALQLATNFHQLRSGTKLRSADALTLVWKGNSSGLRSAVANPPFFIYNIGDHQGFVIVSGEDATKTILGYADEGAFRTDFMPENLRNWLNFYQQEIEAVRAASASAAATSEVATIATGTTTMAPLLGDIKWNQTDPFYLLCPFDSSSNKHALAGCVAVAMAQIMRYHRWPVTGTGSHSYTDENFGKQSVDFSKTTYDWDNMPGTYSSTSTTAQEAAVSTLIYHCGVAVDMAYSTEGSSSTISNAAEAMINHFGYDADMQRYERPYYSSGEWNNLIKNELNNLRPVYFSASSDAGGHAFVCDGYDSNSLFHINWGWGGSSNGYFELSSLSSNYPGIVGAAPEFCYFQSILSNIHKADAVSNATNQILVNKTGLTSSVASVSKINSSSFAITLNFANMGTTSSLIRFGIGYIKEGSNTLTKLVENSSTNYSTISLGFIYTKTFTITNPVVLSTAGKYRLYPIYLPKDSVNWSIMRGTPSLNNCMILTVASTNGAATIQPELAVPQLVLTSTPQIQSRLYFNKTLNVDLSFKNNGQEFFSRVGFCLTNATNPMDRWYICESKVLCPAGETKTFHLSGTVNCPPGNYYFEAVFDSTNSNSTMNYKTFGPMNLNDMQTVVLPTSGPPVLVLNNNISMADGTVIAKNDSVNLMLSITNNGGYFYSRISAFVFPKGGGKSLTSLTTKYVSIDSLETKNFTLNGTLDLVDGDYSFSIYQLVNTSWVSLSPYGMSNLTFTVSNVPSDIAQKEALKPLFIHQMGNQVVLETTAEIVESKCYDLSGRLLHQFGSEKSLPINNLTPGVYLMHVQTTDTKYMERFVIH